MDKNSLQRYFFIGLLFLVSILVFYIFLPFLGVLLLSAIFAVVLSPLQQKLSKYLGGRSGLAAAILVFIFLVVILTPTIFLTLKLLNETKDLYFHLTDGGDVNFIEKVTSYIERPVIKYFPDLSIDFSKMFSLGASWLTGHITSILSSVLSLFTNSILVFFSLFFFLRDGEKFKNILVSLSPLNDEYDEKIVLRLKQTINTTVMSVLLISVIQGLLSGIGMWIFGIPNPTLWGSLSAVVSMVPGLGTTLTFVPAIIYSYFSGNIISTIGLLLWWVLAVGLIDNLLGPYLYSKNTEIPQLIMLFSVIGGLVFFGPIGFIFGPIVLALFFTLIDIYQDLILEGKSL